MEGVILFADDKIHDYDYSNETNIFSQSDENRLYKELASTHAVLAVTNLEAANKTIKTVGSFSAIILDWQYNDEDRQKALAGLEEDESASFIRDSSISEDSTFEFLMNNEIYSLIYVYSTAAAEIEEKYGERLNNRYPGRIFVKDKSNIKNIGEEKKTILSNIADWKEKNKNLAVPILWSQSIIQSVQRIFSKLNQADPNWITELHKTSVIDGVNPEVEVVNLFQNLLSENIIQDSFLLAKIKETAEAGVQLDNPEDYAKLIRILYYGQTFETDFIMTGDIFRVPGSDSYAIIVTPECDIRHVTPDNSYEVLTFHKDGYQKGNFKLKAVIKAKPLIDKADEFKLCTFSKTQKAQISQELNKQIDVANEKLQIESFTQTNPRLHLLPCFEFDENDFSGIGVIDFRYALSLIPSVSLKREDRIGKLNSPYIQELRQRYMSYKGRVGVPGYSKTLREWLLKKH